MDVITYPYSNFSQSLLVKGVPYRADLIAINKMHYYDVVWVSWRLISTVTRLFVQQLVHANSIKSSSMTGGSPHNNAKSVSVSLRHHGPLVRYVKLRVAHAPGMPGTFSPPPRISDPDMHHGTCLTHVPWCMPGSLTSDFLRSLWRRKRSRHSRHMRNLQFYISGKRPMGFTTPTGATHYCCSTEPHKVGHTSVNWLFTVDT